MTPLPDYIVWRIDETEDDLRSQLQHPELFADKVRNLRPGSRRMLEVLAVRRALKELLCGQEVEVLYTADGAPYLQDHSFGGKPCYISISHTEGYALAVCSEVPVGADIERLGKRVERVVSKFLRPEEVAVLQLQDNNYLLAMHLAWCAKETAYKLLGKEYYDLQNLTTVKFIDWDKKIMSLEAKGLEAPLTVHFDVQAEYVLTYSCHRQSE